MFKKVIFSFLLLILGNILNAASFGGGAGVAASGGAAASARGSPNYKILTIQQKLEIWHDVQPAAFYGALPSSITDTVTAYQALPKTDRKALKARIDALQAIAKATEDASTDAIKLLHQTAENKAVYLQGVMDQQPFLKALRLEKDGAGKFRTGVSVKNDNFHSEFLYYIDPGYRTFANIVQLQISWNSAISQDPKTPEFFIWLETVTDLPMEVDPALKKYNMNGPALLKARQVYFDESGQAYHQLYGDRTKASKTFNSVETWTLKPAPFGTGRSNDYLYNIDLDGNLYISAEGIMEKHSHILRGDLVLSAGMVGFNRDGFMIKIDTSSGHFQPTSNNLKEALKKLTDNFNPNILSQTQFGYHAPTGVVYPETVRVDPDALPNQKQTFRLTVKDLAQYKDSFTPEDLATSVTIKPYALTENTITLGELLSQTSDFKEYADKKKEASDIEERLDQPIYLPAQAEAAIVAVGKQIFIKDIGWDDLRNPDNVDKKLELDLYIKDKIAALNSTTTLKDFLTALKDLQGSASSLNRDNRIYKLRDLTTNSINCGDINITTPLSFEMLSQRYINNIKFFLKAYEKAKEARLPDAEALNAITFEDKIYTAAEAAALYTQLYARKFDISYARSVFYSSPVTVTPVIMAAIKRKSLAYRDAIENQNIAKLTDPKERAKARIRGIGRAVMDTKAIAKAAEDDRIAAETEAARIVAQTAAAQRIAAAKAEADRIAAAKAETDRIAAAKAETDRITAAAAEAARQEAAKAEAAQRAADAKAETDRVAAAAEATRIAAAAEAARIAAAAEAARKDAADKAEAERIAAAAASRIAADAANAQFHIHRGEQEIQAQKENVKRLQELAITDSTQDKAAKHQAKILAKLEEMGPQAVSKSIFMGGVKPWQEFYAPFVSDDPDEEEAHMFDFDMGLEEKPSE